MTPHRSAPGSPSKASELDFMMLKQLQENMKVYGEELDVQSHMFRTTITDMQDTYCGDRYEIYPFGGSKTNNACPTNYGAQLVEYTFSPTCLEDQRIGTNQFTRSSPLWLVQGSLVSFKGSLVSLGGDLNYHF